MHVQRFGVVALQAPLPLGRFRLHAIAPKAAMIDMGLSWLFGALGQTEQAAPKPRKRSPPRKQR
jgi:hypothetical protein